MREDVFRKAIEPIKERGSYYTKLSGTIRALPSPFELEFDPEIPKYCVFLDHKADLQAKKTDPGNELLVTVAITFDLEAPEKGEADAEFSLSYQKGWSYYSFAPDSKEDGLKEAVSWLCDYAVRYSSSPHPTILSDFDEHFDHFPGRVDFRQADVASGRINPRLFHAYAKYLNINLNIKEFTHMGDVFSNIGAGATIVNRSTVQGAFNRVRSEFGEEVAQALKRIEDEINKSGNKDAAETFNSFTEELLKPDPKKPILKALWQGVVAAIPTIAQLTEVVGHVKTLIGG
jgi:hypothetical protein